MIMAIKRKSLLLLLSALLVTGGLGAGTALAQTTAAPPALAPAATVPTAPAATVPTAPAAPTSDATAGAAPADASAPSPAAAAPALAPDTSDVTQTTVGNPYGLGALWAGGDIVARATLVILVIMSMGSWYVLITKAIVQFRIFAQAKTVNKTFWQAGSVTAAVQRMKPGTAFHYVAQCGLESLDQHTGLLDKIDIHSFSASAIDDAVIAVQSKMQDGLALLGTVGSTAPFVGLFGTVWGIYHALTAIGIAGQASIDKVAGPVGEALIMTAIGLAVAVPAVLGYNFLVRRNKRAMEMVRKFAKKLLFVLLSADAAPVPVHSELVGEIPARSAAIARA
jgi:biopolymer transport protein ExbB